MARNSRRTAARRAAQPARFCQRYARVEDMPVVHRQAAGIDLAGAAAHFVALEIGDEIEVREFGGTTDEVRNLVAYLVAQQITTVAMEATGVYWEVVYDLLEVAGVEVCLVNPRHVKTVPGRRKDDKLDCRWLQKLHKYGLLSASFRPHPDVRPLQSLHRQRTRLIQLAADELRRMQKALDIMNVRLHKVVSALDGVTGMAIVRAIVAGEQEPATLVRYRDVRCACTPEELQAALTGHYLPQQIVALRQALARYDLLQEQRADLDAEIVAVLQALLPADAPAAEAPPPSSGSKHAPTFPVTPYVQALTGQDPTCLPGIGEASALGLLAELGRDMTKWPTVKHFTSYLTLAPMPKISGGKVLKSSTRPGAHRAGLIFKQAAASITRTDTALGATYRRLAVRCGRGKALTAIARKLAEQYYYLMREGRAYVEHGSAQEEERYRQRQVTQLTRRAAALGYTLTAVA